MRSIALFSISFALSGCDVCDPAATDTGTPVGAETGESGDTGPPASDALIQEELDALATWVSAPVSMTPGGGKGPVDGDRLAILYTGEEIADLEIITAMTRSQDHNSSRSNKSGITFGGDGLDDDDTGTAGDGAVQLRWDGKAACADLPCMSADRPDGAASRLAIELGRALDDDETAMTWAETTPIDVEFSGHLALAAYGRGHVTVLKAAASDDGTMGVTSELQSAYMMIYNGDDVVYEGAPVAGSPLATIDGVTGVSWPKGYTIDTTATGTMVSFSW